VDTPEGRRLPILGRDPHTPRDIRLVGRYALGVDWLDGHSSIFPFDHLRAACDCGPCGGPGAGGAPPAAPRAEPGRMDEPGTAGGPEAAARRRRDQIAEGAPAPGREEPGALAAARVWPAEIRREGSGLRIRWQDGHLTAYEGRRLRTLCRCASCAVETR
jgi:DUF971 family protein